MNSPNSTVKTKKNKTPAPQLHINKHFTLGKFLQ